jgi:RNA polymerase sigma factor, sigma-70 family
MENYINYTDSELLLRVDRDTFAEEELVKRYSRLVKICARPYFLMGGDSEDLFQEGMFGLLSAIRVYDGTMETSFRTYAELCIRRRLLSAIKSASRLKHTPINGSISLDDILSKEDAPDIGVFRRIPEEQLLARESANEFFHTFSRCLSKFETIIINLYLDGLSYYEIAVKVGRPEKSVDNAVQRVRRKLARNHNLGDFSQS